LQPLLSEKEQPLVQLPQPQLEDQLNEMLQQQERALGREPDQE
jgi:hypothetical protein